MKKLILFILVAFSMTKLWSQDPFLFEEPKTTEPKSIPLIGDKAPAFIAQSTNGEVKFPGDYGRSWKILFSHPQDFTPVCTTELLELANLQDQFDKLGVKVLAVSTDRLTTHEQWKRAMEGLQYKDRKPVSIDFPLVADEDLTISKEYGMIPRNSETTKDVRGVFIIDPDNVIQAVYFYPMTVGRNINELVRMVTALEKTKSEHVMTPANWKAGDDVLVPTIPSATASKQELSKDGLYNLAWFMWYKKEN
ncbi:MAG TPA: peroxiredoxin [Bacteroidales bacterium]|nr:peroxiredoxin [Bacteroidales bacterium]